MSTKDISKSAALKFVVLMGMVSLFADMTYEGARSITGPYLGMLGASAAVVGFVAGLGEFLGYGLRLASGYVADRTGRYWPVAIFGYIINLAAVPLLALAGHWWVAGLLIVIERAGKGIRVPARDAMLSHAAHRMGMGWGFGLHEALDQAGAMAGPLLVALVLYLQGSYQHAFVFLLFPALAAMTLLFISRAEYPDPQALEEQSPHLPITSLKKNKAFWVYLSGASLVAFGYADFALIAYHFGKTHLFSPLVIPIAYALALGCNVIMAPLLGHLYDRKGFIVLVPVTFFASFFAPLVFLGGTFYAVIGTLIWGIGLGAQGSLMRAIVAHMVTKDKRGLAYGVFNAVFGLFWFIGSTLMGILYDISITSLVIFSVAAQLLSLPALLGAMSMLPKRI
jgi:MFS family permease